MIAPDTNYELYSAPIDNSAPPIQLNQTLPANTSISNFWISPDGKNVIFADSLYGNQHDIYSVPIGGPATSAVLLCQTPQYDSAISDVRISADSQWVLFLTQYGVNSIPIGGPADKAVLLGSTPTSNNSSGKYDVSGDSQYVVYSNTNEIYSVPMGGPAANKIKLNAALKPDPNSGATTIWNFILSPDGKWVVYSAVLQDTGNPELARVSITGPASSWIELFSSSFDSSPMKISPDSSHIIVLAYPEAEGTKLSSRELYSIPLAGPASAVVKISNNRADGKYLDFINFNNDLQFTPDSQYVIYSEDNPYINTDRTIYSVPLVGPVSAIVRLTQPDFGGNGTGNIFTITPDGSRVIYDDARDCSLFSIPVRGPLEAANDLSGDNCLGMVSGYLKVQVDNEQVVYLEQPGTPGSNDIYTIPIDGPVAHRTKLNGTVAPDGMVYSDFLIAPVSGKVVYRSEEEQAGQIRVHINAADAPSTDNPVPSISNRSPYNILADSGDFSLDIYGANFVKNNSVVRWNGSPRTTTFFSSSHLQVAIPAADIAVAASVSITVFNSAPGGGESNAITYMVRTDAFPVITSLSPVSTLAGADPFTLDVYGFNFLDQGGSLLNYNGVDHATTYLSVTHLQATITTEETTPPGNAVVYVDDPNYVQSNSIDFPQMSAPPVLTSFSPNSGNAGDGPIMIDVYGKYFVNHYSYVRLNTVWLGTNYLSSTHLQATIPPEDLVTAGTASIDVYSESPFMMLSTSLPFTINASIGNPYPIVNSLSPSNILIGAPAFTLNVYGVDFMSGSVVRWNGSALSTTFMDSTWLKAAVPASDLITAGNINMTVFTPTPRGGTSDPIIFYLDNPAPSISSFDPAFVYAGGGDFTLNIIGDNFLDNGLTTVQIYNSNRQVTFISPQHLQVSVLASDITSIGTLWGEVINASPGGGGYNFYLDIEPNNGPLLFHLNPAVALVGGSGFTLNVYGLGFVNDGPTVTWNGSSRPTTFVSDQHLQAAISAADIAAVGSVIVKVGSSNELTFNINNPAPALTSLSPSSVVVGGVAFTLDVYGAGFQSSGQSTIQWNGSDRPTTYISSTHLSASIPAPDVASTGLVSITVVTKTPGGGASNALTLTIGNEPAPSLTSITPVSVAAGGGDFTLTVTGTVFTSGSVIMWNDQPCTTQFVSGTKLTANIPAAWTTKPGTVVIKVVNGGSVTSANSINLTITAAVTSTKIYLPEIHK